MISSFQFFLKELANIAQKSKILNFSHNKLGDTPTFCYYIDFKSNIQLIGHSVEKEIKFNTCQELKNLDVFIEQKDYKFGYLSYDLKNCFERLESNNSDKLNFDLGHFFIPKNVVEINNNKINNLKGELALDSLIDLENSDTDFDIEMNASISKNDYLKKISAIKNHIHLGDIYETNFCYEFSQKDIEIDPFELFIALSKRTNASFAAFCKFDDKYIISASPERFLKKTGNKLISQPIKGTRKASNNATDNLKIIEELKNDPKERSENIMIVDLVRNDLSRIASRNSVKVDELCAIHSFKNVHQMVSTISCEINDKTPFSDILKATFPMGSMTGAPKISAMQLMEKYESTKRGLYSGSLGYFTPNNDFDFNVVIRTFLYNQSNNYLSFMVGGAIIDQCIPENEYEETLVKANALLNAIKNK